jgi:hypothetical protein
VQKTLGKDEQQFKLIIARNAIDRQRALDLVKRAYKLFSLKNHELLLQFARECIESGKHTSVFDTNLEVMRRFYRCCYNAKRADLARYNEMLEIDNPSQLGTAERIAYEIEVFRKHFLEKNQLNVTLQLDSTSF